MCDEREKLLDLVAAHPDYSVREYSEILGMDVGKTTDLYKELRDPVLKTKILLKTPHPEFVETFSEVVDDKDWFEAMSCGDFRFPRIIEFHPGRFCNLKCKHCFSNEKQYDGEIHNREEISFDCMKQLFEVSGKNGTKEIWFSGGKEPAFSPNTIGLIDLASNKLDFDVKLYTNSLLIDVTEIPLLMNCKQVRVSINAASAGVYKRICGVDGFDKVLFFLEKMVEAKRDSAARVSIVASMIVQPDNYFQIADFVRLILCEIGADRVHLRVDSMGITPPLTAGMKNCVLEQIDSIEKDLVDRLDMRGLTDEELSVSVLKRQFYSNLVPPKICKAGRYKRAVDPFGNVFHCEFASHPFNATNRPELNLGNLQDEDAEVIFRRGFGKTPLVCDFCQAHEYGLNMQIRKFQKDFLLGINFDEHPFGLRQ